jgi:predicted RNase H-like HicB family nuclease
MTRCEGCGRRHEGGIVVRRYIVVVVPDEEDGGFVASVPAVPGVYGQGETEDEAYRDVVEALTFTLDSMTEEGEEIPPSDAPKGVVREVELAV